MPAAKAGDVLILTKPIGTGAINTAVKKGIASDETIAAVDPDDDHIGRRCV